ncbi:MAG: hypothetical protein HC866_13435 [Leptolyngbyaceae cyanobacterium RU_5_1]|nr:hypothetical protein [Leptolyngbyaceae cyanobacterium RU_5_1]
MAYQSENRCNLTDWYRNKVVMSHFSGRQFGTEAFHDLMGSAHPTENCCIMARSPFYHRLT